jgi:hypothetical protein
VRNLEIIGKAANSIDPDFKAINPDIETNRINTLIYKMFLSTILDFVFGL